MGRRICRQRLHWVIIACRYWASSLARITRKRPKELSYLDSARRMK